MRSAPTIDLNADLGESYGNWRIGDDAGMLSVVTSANIACGFHAGDPLTLARACALAAERGVTIGAQVGYNHLPGFGRWRIDMPAPELTADVIYQIGALDGLARVAGTRVAYVKPHGALYNTAAVDERQAQAVVDAVAAYDPSLPILGLPDSVLLRLAEAAGLRTIREAFADRAYRRTGRLVARHKPGAFITDDDEVAARVVRLVREGVVTTRTGREVAIEADSVCLHSDTPGAVDKAYAVRTALEAAGVVLAPVVPPPAAR